MQKGLPPAPSSRVTARASALFLCLPAIWGIRPAAARLLVTRHFLIGSRVQILDRKSEAMRDSSLKTKLAFYSWLALLLITLGTFAAGLFGHFVTLIAAPWLSLRNQAAIHATIPVLLTAVKFVTVPLFLLLTPFARRHPTFRSWTNWSKSKFRQLEQILRIPWSLAKALFLRAKSMFQRREGVKSGSPGKGDKSSL
jgi:hypothetical protein